MKIRRVIVGLEPVPRSQAMIEAAVALAARMEADLLGMFIENIDLLHFAGLPFASELGTTSARRRTLDVASLERVLRARAREAEQALASAAKATPVRWTFRVARGPAAGMLLGEATEADLVIANIAQLEASEEPVRIRVVRAGDVRALRAALEAEDAGILVLTGADAALIGRTLRQLTERWRHGG